MGGGDRGGRHAVGGGRGEVGAFVRTACRSGFVSLGRQ